MFMDEYTLHSLDDVQARWLFGKNSFIVSIERTKKWIDSLFVEDLAQRLDYQIRSQGIKYTKLGSKSKPTHAESVQTRILLRKHMQQ